MFLVFSSGILAGMLSGILFAFAFTWNSLDGFDHGRTLLTPIIWIVPSLYGSVFAVGYAFLATSCVMVLSPLVSRMIPQPNLSHAFTTCFILSITFYLLQSPNPSHATMIEFGSYKGCCFLSAGLVTQTSVWNSRRSRTFYM